MITQYWYDNQLRQYMLQFVSIFYGLRVRTGKGECDEAQYISVPIVIGNKDRVVAAIMAGNTSNRSFSLPAMAANLQTIALAPERRRTPGLLHQQTTMPVGGVFPDDLTTIKRSMPVPYNATVELTIYASNTDQLHQILEQILVLFNPDIQIQKSDAPFDWTKLTKVELVDIANEENYPSGTDKRVIQWSLTFEMPIYLSVPMGVKDDLIRKIIIQIGELTNMEIGEVDEDGAIIRMGEKYAEININTANPGDPDYALPDPEGPVPPEPEPLP